MIEQEGCTEHHLIHCTLCSERNTTKLLRSELQRYKDALEACKEVITRLGGCVCDDCIEREVAAIQAAKDKKGN